VCFACHGAAFNGKDKVILKKAIGASRALSELKGAITNLKRYIPLPMVTGVRVGC